MREFGKTIKSLSLLGILYLVIFYFSYSPTFYGDETRYLSYAQTYWNALFHHGSWATDFWSGPGYSIFLTPFVGLGFPLWVLRLFNVILLFFSYVFLNRSLLFILPQKKARIITLIVGVFYYLPFKTIALVLSESYTQFLISLVLYFAISLFKSNTWRNRIYLGISLGMLSLVKVIFCYVFIVLFCLYFFALLFKWRSRVYLIPILISFIFQLFYLIYTYSYSNKLFVYSTAGGMQLYWMSSPYENEYGEWNNTNFSANQLDSTNARQLKQNHQDIIQNTFANFTVFQMDSAYKSIAIQNIKENSGKFAFNVLCNISRLFFQYPNSFRFQTPITLFYIIPNMFVLVFLCFASLLYIRNLKRLPIYIYFVIILSIIYLTGTILISAYERFFYILTPLFVFYIAYAFEKFVSINFLNSKEN